MKVSDPEFSTRFPHLAKHLEFIKTFKNRNACVAQIRTIPLPEMAQIILEAREAIIDQVKNTILGNKLPLVFLIGGTGSGKSTTMCFLRGDEMLLKDFEYFSKSDQTQTLIGHELSVSCTFLPNIELLKEFILVDFPGFEDTNGPLIHLGAELALKALIAQYDSKALVIESITNTEDRYNAISKLVFRLKRLFTNPKDCLLGLTKYSRMVGSSETIKKTEETFLKLTSFTQLLSFKNLEDKSLLEDYRAILNSPMMPFIRINPQLSLDAEDHSLLNARFEAYLEDMYSCEINTQSNSYANLDELFQDISRYSLIHATQVQLGEFLHLPEINPDLIKEFDKKLMDYCLKRYIKAIVSINLMGCKEHLKRLERNTHVLVLEESVLALENYTRGLLGIPADGDKKWADYVMHQGAFSESADKLFKLPNWVQNLPFISTEIPNTVYNFARKFDWDKENQQIPLETIESCVQEIEEIKNTLTNLAKMKNMIYFTELSELSMPSEAMHNLDPFKRKQVILFKMLMLNRSFKSHHALSIAIKEILDKANHLEHRGFHQEAKTIQDFVGQLVANTDEYMKDPHSKEQYQEFRNATFPVIQQTKNILKEHRDCHYILANIALAVAGLGIFYGIALLVNRVQTGHWLFFDKTDSVKKLDQVENALGMLNPA